MKDGVCGGHGQGGVPRTAEPVQSGPQARRHGRPPRPAQHHWAGYLCGHRIARRESIGGSAKRGCRCCESLTCVSLRDQLLSRNREQFLKDFLLPRIYVVNPSDNQRGRGPPLGGCLHLFRKCMIFQKSYFLLSPVDQRTSCAPPQPHRPRPHGQAWPRTLPARFRAVPSSSSHSRAALHTSRYAPCFPAPETLRVADVSNMSE